ncbi:MAG: chloride channel protein [Alphaproteobacteria bacterium]|nr:chloride channel protein [Alphaproteobacteria bacterium]
MTTVEPKGVTARLRRFVSNEQIRVACLAVFVGGLGGGAGIAFREAIGLIQYLFFGFSDERFHSNAASIPFWIILLAPVAGGLIVGPIVHYLMPDRRPQGVADVMEASAFRRARMSRRMGIGGFVVSAITIGSGASAGREGPVVHFAAFLSTLVSSAFKLDPELRRILLGCAVAAGVASSFNAPIAGVFFALEVVIGSYALANFAPVVFASVTGTIVSRSYFGDFPAFIIPQHEIASFWEFPAFAILGCLSAGVAMALVWSVQTVRRAHDLIKLHPILRPAAGGLLVGAIGVFFPQVMGVGYEATDEALNELLPLYMLVLLIVMKTAATAITLGSGFGGGIFSPSLFLGAMLGGAFGLIATEFLPHMSSGHGAYTLVGMGAVAGATLGAPISTFFIVYELTREPALTIAVMIATVISTQIFTALYQRSFFHWQLAERGINLMGSRESRIIRQTSVQAVMEQDYVTIQPNALLPEMRDKLTQTRYSEIFVTDEEARLVGTIMLADLGKHAFSHERDKDLRAIDVCRRSPPVATVDMDLEEAMNLLEDCNEEHIAVVAGPEDQRLMGVLHEHDVMARYHQCIIETRREEAI